jgi:hypothetical protein
MALLIAVCFAAGFCCGALTVVGILLPVLRKA